MKITTHPFYLEFLRPFALAHGSRTGTDLVFIRLEHEDFQGWGEASLPPYRKETQKSVIEVLEKWKHELDSGVLNNPIEKHLQIPFSSDAPAASNALQTAIFDRYARKNKKRLSDYFKKTAAAPLLTLTITKNDFDFLADKINLENHFTHFKLKLTGSDDDLDFVKAIRKKTSLPFSIDCNQGYSKKESAISLVSHLEKLNVCLIEQPLNDRDHDGHYWLKQRSSFPVIADESICNLHELKQFHEAYSGVNIKLIKCGGMMQAQEMIDFLREKKQLVLIGCMSESSLGVATAAVLAQQCDMADLDAPYLNKNNPFSGFQIRNRKIEIEGGYGTGVEPVIKF